MMQGQASFGILIGALGGEGGGVLADWIVSAATALDFPVQSTSIPGVAQRTGATTYYIELYPTPRSELNGASPVFALMPSAGRVDLVAATELMEAGRAVQNGFTHPQRTTIVASSHREYAVLEKAVPGDGRFDSARAVEVARKLSRQLILFDMRALAQQHGTVINSVLFGAMSGSGVLPLRREACEDAIRASGKAVKASLAGFAAGFNAAGKGGISMQPQPRRSAPRLTIASLEARISAYPAAAQPILRAGLAQLVDYQDEAYAHRYLERVEEIAAVCAGQGPEGDSVLREAARYLALWMSYEDVIRVADLKSRATRLQRVREEVGAPAGDPMRVTEFLKPGLDELCSVLPRSLGGWLQRRYADRAHSLNRGIHLRSDTVLGFLALCTLRSLRPMRPRTWRFAREQEAIEAWLRALRQAMPMHAGLAQELALAGNVVKGYGETNERGQRNLKRILSLAARATPANADEVMQQVKQERLRALSEGETPTPTVGGREPVIKPISFMPRRSATRGD